MILQSQEMANGVQKKAAELLQLKPSTLNEMMKRLGIHTKSNANVEEEVGVEQMTSPSSCPRPRTKTLRA
jgi:hypothetical protein